MLPAITVERLKSLLEDDGFSYKVKEDESLVIHFSPLVVFIEVKNTLLSFTGMWRADIISNADLENLYQVCSKLNEELFFPKTYVQDPHGDRTGSVFFEFNIPLQEGAS